MAALLEYGARVDARNLDECTPLHCAAESCSLECARLLLEAGADTSHVCVGGRFDHNVFDTPSSALAHACIVSKVHPSDGSRFRGLVTHSFGVADRRKVADLLLCFNAGLDNDDLEATRKRSRQVWFS